jgi:hypothetical protein
MQQPPDAPITQRLRIVRRRVAAAVLATFVAAWLAVAALGKGAGTTTTPATTTYTQSDAGSSSSSTQSGDDSGANQSSEPAPVTTAQS